jgi:hypothetical protein
MTGRESFDTVAERLAEVVDDILTVPRPRARRLELIAHHIRRGIVHGYRAAKRQHNAGDGIKPESER